MSAVEPDAEYIDLLLANGERAGDATQLGAGEVVFSEGDVGKRMFLVKTGTVSLRLGGQVIEQVGPRGLFGEMALLGAQRRSLSAVAETDCELVAIESDRFWYLVRDTPYFAQIVMKAMAERLQRQTGPPPS